MAALVPCLCPVDDSRVTGACAAWHWGPGVDLRRLDAPADHALLFGLRRSGKPGLVLFTGGTTARPKAVLHDADEFLAARESSTTRDYRLLSIMPMQHVGGLDTLVRLWWSGATLVVPQAHGPLAVAEAIVDGGVEVLVTPPSFLNLFCLAGPICIEAGAILRVVAFGAEPMLSRLFGGVTIMHRNVLETAWPFPANVSLVSVGTYLHIRESERKPASWKAAMFVRYAWEMLCQLRRGRREVVLLYDPIPLLAYRLVARLLGYTPKVWYHNWDIIEASRVRKFSITWCAAKSEAGMMAQVNLFSLPIDERKPYFAMARLKGRYLLIPNYPVRDFYGRRFAEDRRPPVELRLLYSGSIGPGHGLEEIIRLLPRTLCGRRLKLVLKGHLRPEFEATLRHLAHEHGVGEQVEVVQAGAYQGVFSVLERCDVGIAIYTGQDLMNRMMSIGPSKVYKYIAAGMPVLFFEPHWRQAFSSHFWAIPTDLSEESLGRQLEFTIRDYLFLARAAAADFRAHLHCDGFYQKAAAILLREDGATAV